MPRKPSPARQLTRLLDAAQTPLYAVDGQRRLVYGNAAFSAWVGRSAEELAGLKLSYTTSGSLTGAAELAAALCPPPEAFSGEVLTGVVAAPTGGDVAPRQAQFVVLGGGDGEPAGLCVVVGGPAESSVGGSASHGSPLHEQLLELRRELGRRFHIGQLIGKSPQMGKARRLVRLAAQGRVNVLIVGPPGSGREHVARTIHYAPQAAGASVGPLVPVDCSLLDAESMQSAVTSFLKRREQPADRPPAMLLLDADRMSGSAQQELAGFLRLPGIELVLLATATTPLSRLARQGKFRPELACALDTLTIALPSLAARAGDVPLLAQFFLEEANADGGKQLSGFSSEALDLLTAFSWPGNVEQLAEVVRQAHAAAEGLQVQAGDLPPLVHHADAASVRPARAPQPLQLDDFLTRIEKELLTRALAQARGNKSKAAKLLGIHRARLIRRLAQLGLAAPPAEEPVVFEETPVFEEVENPQTRGSKS